MIQHTLDLWEIETQIIIYLRNLFWCLGIECSLKGSILSISFCLTKIYVTSQGERVPRGMGIQYSRTNILGDMSKYMNNSDSFILN